MNRRRIWIAIAAVVLLPILVPLITVRSAKGHILRAIEAGLGRGIQADAVHLRLFPLPGVELDNVRLADDPAFGLEEMVVADDATAAVSLGALFQGRLVFARIHLDRPSINLVRNQAGEWNIAALLDRTGALSASRGSSPAGSRARGNPSRFPYIEWSDARVNFKLEETKTRFYLDQVQGSLARDSGGWRLQARFQPERTDLNLSNTGEVTLDGRWPFAGGGNFRQRPFAVALRLENSYLAGSSALLAGHDAGVHGILSARMQVQGAGGGPEAPAPGIRVSGAFQAQSLRRWDLLPPAATIGGAFAGVYDPGQDRFTLEDAGDSGYQHFDLQGEVANVFTRPSATLRLDLRQFSAAGLLPLVMAVKAHLPAHLQADGMADGEAELQWAPGALQGQARISLSRFRLATPREEFRLPTVAVAWDGHRLSLPATEASIGAPGAAAPTGASGAAAPTPVRVAASVDRQGFAFHLDSPSFTAAAAASLADLFGLRSPWPPDLAGEASLHLGLASDWSGFRQAGWTGTATFPTARFEPSGGDDGDSLPLTNVVVAFADPQPMRVAFTTRLRDTPAEGEGNTVSGLLTWAPGAAAPLGFELRAPRLRDGAVWRLLHPPPGGLVQRVLGDVTGDATPPWIGRLHAAGTVAVDDLDWKGVHAGVRMELQAAPGLWQFSGLRLSLGGGSFGGSGRLEKGYYEITGATPANAPVHLAEVLTDTAYQGLLAGELSGSLALRRPVGAAGLGTVAADGDFTVRRGKLATAAGVAPFERFSGRYHLDQGTATFSQVVWVAGGERWEGKGTAAVGAAAGTAFDLELHRRGQRLHLEGKLTTQPSGGAPPVPLP